MFKYIREKYSELDCKTTYLHIIYLEHEAGAL